MPFDKLDYIKTLIDKITKMDVINNVKIVDIFKKNDLTIYTIRYFLIDTKQFTLDELNNTALKIKSL